MSILFETTRINGMTLSNRIFRSATWEGLAAENGDCTDGLINKMAELADGRVGLIVTGHAYVEPRGQASPWQLGLYRDSQVTGLKRLVDAVHSRGGKIAIQLAHAGLFADTNLTGELPIAPSATAGFIKSSPQPMSQKDIADVIAAFAAAADRARSAGFDAIQLHAAHGYLLSQFLSPVFNLRTDDFGGSVENRTRLVVSIANKIRHKIGSETPLLIKMNTRDFLTNGLELDDALGIGRILANSGLDAIELSGGTGASGKLGPVRTSIRTDSDEAYFKEAAAAFKQSVDLPIVLVGGVRSFGVAENLIHQSTADYIAMSRPFIREPGLVRRWLSGDLRPSTCVSDSRCFVPARSGQGVYCVVEKRSKERPAKTPTHQ